jgi:hypothetical protein
MTNPLWLVRTGIRHNAVVVLFRVTMDVADASDFAGAKEDTGSRHGAEAWGARFDDFGDTR